jgi:hypothetical protein
MATVAERFWAEMLDIRRPVEDPGRPHVTRRKAVLVRSTRGTRVRTKR